MTNIKAFEDTTPEFGTKPGSRRTLITKQQITHAILTTVFLVTGLSFMVTIPAHADHARSHKEIGKDVIIKCWKPLFRNKPYVHVIQGSRNAAKLAKNIGCTSWKIIKEHVHTSPGIPVQRGLVRGGCDPEQARAMGFKPERGDCK